MHLYVYVYTHTHLSLFIFFSIMIYYKILNIVTCAVQLYLVVTHSMCSSLHLLNPGFPVLSLSPLGNHKSILSVCFCFVDKSTYVIFLDSHVSDAHLSFCLTHLV